MPQDKKKGINDWFVVNKKDSGNEILIYDSIGYDGYDMGETFAGFKAAADPLNEYTIRIHSPGGFVDTGLAIYDYNKERIANGAKVHARVDGVCASIATVIALSGSERPELTENASVMIHPVKGGVYGEIKEMEQALEHATVQQNKVAKIYKKELGWTDDYVEKLMMPLAETWYHGEEAVSSGFCRGVIATPMKESNSLVACWNMTEMSKKFNYKDESNLYKQSGGEPMPKDEQNQGAAGEQNTAGKEPVTMEGLLSMVTNMQGEMNKLTTANEKQADDIAQLTTDKADLTQKLEDTTSAKDVLAGEKAESDRIAREVQAKADYSKTMNKMGSESDIVALAMAVEDNCTEEVNKIFTDVMTRANNVITESGFDVQDGGDADDEISEETKIENFRKELLKEDPTMSEYNIQREINRKFLTTK